MNVEEGTAGSGVIGVSSKASNGTILYLADPGLLSAFVPDNDEYMLELTSDSEYEAQLVLKSYPVNIDTGITGGTVTADKDSAGSGETVTLTAVPEIGMVLKSITVTDGNGDQVEVNGNSFVMPRSAVTVSAVFETARTYYIEWDYEITNGSIHIPSASARAGEMVIVTAEPDAERVTASLTVLSNDENHMGDFVHEVPGVTHPDPNTITFTMPSADVKVFAEFSDHFEKRVFIRDMEGGTVIADRNLARDGDKVTLTIQPDNGYTYDQGSLSVKRVDYFGHESDADFDEVTEDSVYTFIMGYDNVYVNASFTKVPEQPKYNVTIETDEMEYGTLTADYSQASETWKVTLTAVPEHNYALKSLTVIDRAGNEYETTSVGSDRYTFIMPACDVFVTAVFAVPSYPITAVTVDNGTDCEILVDSEAENAWPVDVVCILRPDTYVKSLTVRSAAIRQQ